MYKKHRCFSASLFILLLIISVNSKAEVYPYIGASIGISAADEECEDDAPYYDPQCEGNASGRKLFGGIRVHKYAAVEVSYMDMGEMAKTIDMTRITAESTGTNISIVGIYPVGDYQADSFNLELFGKLGLLRWDTMVINHTSGVSSDDDGTDPSYGIGASVGGEKLFFTLEFEVLNEVNGEYSPGGTTLTYASIGATYRF